MNSKTERRISEREKDTLAWRLSYARRTAGLTQLDTGYELGLTDKAISAYEAGRCEPTLQNLRRLAKLYKRPTTWFLEPFDANDDTLSATLTMINTMKEQLDNIREYIDKALRG